MAVSVSRLASRVPAFATGLALRGDRPALHTKQGAVTYAELDDAVEAVAARLGVTRRLVLIRAASSPAFVAAYLGALRGGHVVMIVDGDADHAAGLTAAYDPDVVLEPGTADSIDVDLVERRRGTAHDLHRDLTLLLSTSGSTGSPKLVRLSAENVDANAAAIAEYLAIDAADCAAITLPLHYCYGLSILHSNLLRGASVLLTDWSVVDRCFWRRFRAVGGTSISGVPHTFELLERAGFEDMHLPSLRYVTQAGGRLAPEKVRRYASLGAERGWRFFVMYGQTEATARMAYLPPDLAASRPEAIGIPVRGGHFVLDPVDGVEPGVGELVYVGPNVMLGYATNPADLARGRTVERLRTGDLARSRDGLFELVGRRSRFVKPFGVRVDLDRVEQLLAADGLDAAVAGDDRELVLALDDEQRAGAAQARVTALTGLPLHAVRVSPSPIPRRANGKPDYAAMLVASPTAPPLVGQDACVVGLYRDLLGVDDVRNEDTFVDLGGDSLSYVELSMRLESILGDLPEQWPTMSVGALEMRASARRTSRTRTWRRVDTTIVLRAVAIIAVVGTHAGLLRLRGGAHVLLAVAGFNMARFQLAAIRTNGRVRDLLVSAARIAVPTAAWVGLLVAVTDRYSVANVALVNNRLGERAWGQRWEYWYIEALVQLLVAGAALLAAPAVRRFERQRPFALPITAAVVALAVRFDALSLGYGDRRIHMPETVAWLFAIGWAAQRARTFGERALVTALAAIGAANFSGFIRRDAAIFVGLAVLIWIPTMKVPALLARVLATVAAGSLYVYLTHWQVYRPLLDVSSPLVATLASFVVGLGVAAVISRLGGWWRWSPRRGVLSWRRLARSERRADRRSDRRPVAV